MAAKSRRPDPELEAGARAHFDDPLYYSETYDWRDEDAVYYRKVAIASGGGPVLEHGIGNGRVALPLARAGIEVTGIDHSRPMLDDLRTRLKAERPSVRRRVKLHEGDMRTASLGRRFPLVICPFNAALHLYTREDVEEWLARTREHLEPDGKLVFDISVPIAKDLARDPSTAYRIAPFKHPTAGRVKYREYFDYDPVRQILFVSMFFDPAPRAAAAKTTKTTRKRAPKTKPKDTGFMTPLAHRQFYPREMEALLHYNGYEILDVHGDFEGGPLVVRSDVMIWHARPRKRGGRSR